MKQFAYIFAFALLMCLMVFMFKQCEIRKLTRTLEYTEAALDSCLNAAPTRDTLWLFKTLTDTVHLRYTYRVTDTVRTSDAIVSDGGAFGDEFGLEEREYTGNYTTELINVRWRATIIGELKSIDILPTSTYRFPQITLTKTVTLPARLSDAVKLSREKSHLYMMGGIGYYKPTDMLYTVGLQFISKKGWGIGATSTLNNEGRFYWGGSVIMRVL